jgi:low affinity Fe/Cu permease
MSKRPQYFFETITAWIGSVPSFVAHTIFFAASFGVGYFGFAEWNTVLLVLTTAVSLEAIYLAIFIQMTVNRQSAEIQEVSEDVEEIQEDLEEISEDVEEISEDVEEIQEDVEGIQEDVEEISEDWDLESGKPLPTGNVTLEQLTEDVKKILASLEQFKKK